MLVNTCYNREVSMERILLVDDDVGLCESWRNISGPEGFQVDIAHEGNTLAFNLLN